VSSGWIALERSVTAFYDVIEPHELAMATETCLICGDEVAFSDTVHLMVHTNSEEGVLDAYVCRTCYESELAPYFE